MKSHRKISLTTALLAALVAVVPACASANSLLSGYGGPGAGNQAILGSALIGGGGSSGSNGPTGSSGSSSDSAVGSEAAGSGEASTGSNGQGTGEASSGGKGAASKGKGSSGAAGSQREHGKASGGAARAYPVRPLDDASKPTSAGSGALGFSAADFGYLLLVVAVLGATGLVTRRLARAPTPIGRPAATGKGP